MNLTSETANNINLIVAPFTVVIDTQEQAAWNFRGLRADADDHYADLVVPTLSKKLRTGDYSIVGMENLVTIERKSLGDAYNTFGDGRDRWERELKRMVDFQFAAVVVEAGWPSVLAHVQPPSASGRQFTAKHFYRSVIAWQVRFPMIQWWFCPSRTFAERSAFRLLQRFWLDNANNEDRFQPD